MPDTDQTLPTVDKSVELLGGFELEPFEGHPVVSAGIEIPGAAGGLRDAMKVEPRAWHQNERVYVLLECDVAKVRMDPIDRSDLGGAQRRVHVLSALAGTVMEPDVAKPAIDTQKARILKAREEALGIQRAIDVSDDGKTASPAKSASSDGFVDMTLVRKALAKRSNADLHALLDTNKIKHRAKATSAEMVDLLISEVADVAEQFNLEEA